MSEYLDLLKEIGSKIRVAVMGLFKSKTISLAEKLSLNPHNQFTRKIDKLAEDIAIEIIEERGITTYIISEEIGEKIIGKGEPDIFIVLDPVDGTRNAISGIPFFSTSLALGKYNPDITFDSVEVGYVLDIYNNISFWAEKGKKAYEDGNRITSSRNKNLKNSLVSVYAYKYPKSIKSYQEIAVDTKIRTLGSQALEICYTASGKIDACMDFRGISRVVDTAAAKLILEEAGGIFYTFNTNHDKIALRNAKTFSFIAAPNKEFLKNLIILFNL
jgi:myo-inositol-1(or 4)-monophosphatase